MELARLIRIAAPDKITDPVQADRQTAQEQGILRLLLDQPAGDLQALFCGCQGPVRIAEIGQGLRPLIQGRGAAAQQGFIVAIVRRQRVLQGDGAVENGAHQLVGQAAVLKFLRQIEHQRIGGRGGLGQGPFGLAVIVIADPGPAGEDQRRGGQRPGQCAPHPAFARPLRPFRHVGGKNERPLRLAKPARMGVQPAPGPAQEQPAQQPFWLAVRRQGLPFLQIDGQTFPPQQEFRLLPQPAGQQGPDAEQGFVRHLHLATQAAILLPAPYQQPRRHQLLDQGPRPFRQVGQPGRLADEGATRTRQADESSDEGFAQGRLIRLPVGGAAPGTLQCRLRPAANVIIHRCQAPGPLPQAFIGGQGQAGVVAAPVIQLLQHRRHQGQGVAGGGVLDQLRHQPLFHRQMGDAGGLADQIADPLQRHFIQQQWFVRNGQGRFLLQARQIVGAQGAQRQKG